MPHGRDRSAGPPQPGGLIDQRQPSSPQGSRRGRQRLSGRPLRRWLPGRRIDPPRQSGARLSIRGDPACPTTRRQKRPRTRSPKVCGSTHAQGLRELRQQSRGVCREAPATAPPAPPTVVGRCHEAAQRQHPSGDGAPRWPRCPPEHRCAASFGHCANGRRNLSLRLRNDEWIAVS